MNDNPRALSEEEIKFRVERFQSYFIKHRNFGQSLEAIKEFIYQPGRGGIVLVIGPSHVGKSSLFSILQRQILNEQCDEMNRNPGFIPIAGIEANVPTSGSFGWNDYFASSLKKMNEPLIEKKIIIAPQLGGPSKYQKSYENCLKYRRLLAFCIDEAQHLGRCANAKKFLNQFDVLKAIVNSTKVPHILFGVYELTALINVSSQFINRLEIIHFRRYTQQRDDMKIFGDVIHSLRKQIPIENTVNIEKDYLDYCYDQTIGCVGILKKWMTDAVGLTLRKGSKELTIDHLHSFARSKKSLQKLLRDAVEGEERVFEALEKKDYREYTKLPEADVESKKLVKATNKKPGQRNPIWDEIGDGPSGLENRVEKQ